MPDEDRVFDVTKPSRVNPSATSKPVIAGHRPTLNDPMVREVNTTRIQVNDTSESPPADANRDRYSYAPVPEPEPPAAPEPPVGAPGLFSDPAPLTPDTTVEPTAAPAIFHPTAEQAPADNTQPIEAIHFDKPRHKRRWPKALAALLVLAIAAYLLIDAGVIGSNINLPLHIFKQKQPSSATNNPPPSANNATTSSVPTGFKEYKLAGTNLDFAAPTTWGDPTSSAEPGYSQRGGANQSAGTYAYLVNFATNKDIQIVVTSSKFLPVSRPAPLYYDYLQWCKGTNDGKIYESILHFTTANKVDTPTTITCDQGPVTTATEIDSTTILQPKATDTANKVIGDIYTKNLTDPSLVVFRVKDAAMTNGTDIKTLLGTVKLTASSTSSSSNSSSSSQ